MKGQRYRGYVIVRTPAGYSVTLAGAHLLTAVDYAAAVKTVDVMIESRAKSAPPVRNVVLLKRAKS